MSGQCTICGEMKEVSVCMDCFDTEVTSEDTVNADMLKALEAVMGWYQNDKPTWDELQPIITEAIDQAKGR